MMRRRPFPFRCFVAWLRGACRALASSGYGALVFAAFAAPAAATCLPMAGLPQSPVTLTSLRTAVPALPAPPVTPWRAQSIQADRGPKLPDGMVEITYIGHSSFLIRTPADVTAITDYNGYNRPSYVPDIVTMNRAHSSHYTDYVEPEVTHVLRGWDDLKGMPYHDVQLRDVRVRNVPTNIRDGRGGTEFAGNSIFVFETAGLCIAHVGHLHHTLTPEQRGRIGEVDVLMVPIDDGMTMPQIRVAEVVAQLSPTVVIPMHYFGHHQVERFLDLLSGQGYAARYAESPVVRFTKRSLPKRTVLILTGGS